MKIRDGYVSNSSSSSFVINSDLEAEIRAREKIVNLRKERISKLNKLTEKLIQNDRLEKEIEDL